MQRLGQHFLRNRTALKIIADNITLDPADTIIEIGPGHGEMTTLLIDTEADKIIAIEKDENLYRLLVKKFEGHPRFSPVLGDALKILPAVVHELKKSGKNYHIVGNIPYYITGHLFRIVGELEKEPVNCVFTIQKEVAERICAQPPRMNRLAASVQFWAKPHIVKILKATDFAPPPKVDSAILLLTTTPRERGGDGDYYGAVRILFAQPRKTIGNNIAAATKQNAKEISEKLSAISIDPSARPQNLTPKEILSIAGIFPETAIP